MEVIIYTHVCACVYGMCIVGDVYMHVSLHGCMHALGVSWCICVYNFLGVYMCIIIWVYICV